MANKRETALYKDTIPNYYAFADRVIGYFLEKLDQDTVLIVVSDHGFQRSKSLFLFDVNKMLNKMGYLDYKKNNKIKKNKMYDTTLYWLSFYLDRDIKVNLTNLFPPQSPAKELISLTKITNQLQSIKVGGIPFFKSVKLKKNKDVQKRIFHLKAKINEVFASPRYIEKHLNLLETVDIGGKKYPMGEFFSFSQNSGDHLIDGVFIAHGKGIKKNFIVKNMGILDITPTILKIMGFPIAEDMPGKPALSILNADFKQALPNKTIPSYDILNAREKTKIKKSKMDKVIKKRLKALGYIQ
jgi:predicted AlkP superfamily phosphohydrolase/phosphomutase